MARGFESAFLAGKFSLYQGAQYSLALEAVVGKYLSREVSLNAAGNAAKDLDKVELSDRGEFYRLGPAVSFYLGNGFHLNTRNGVVLPGEDQSIEYAFDFSFYWMATAFALGVGLDGVYSFDDDDYGDNPRQKPFRAVGSTHSINSINRNFHRLYGAINLNLAGGLRVELMAGEVLDGEWWDQFAFTQVNLIYRKDDPERFQKRVESSFKEYEVEAQVISVSPRGLLAKIDKGHASGIFKGMRFDIYDSDHHGKNVLVATGSVFRVSEDESIVKILKWFKEDSKIEEGFKARGKR